MPSHPKQGIALALDALNFFMADVQAGVGPFLGVYLAAHGWRSGLIGTVLAIGGVFGMLVTTPVGALIDSTRRKRSVVVIAGVCTLVASAVVLVSQSFWVVSISQVGAAIAGAAVGPAVAGITLGLARQSGFTRRIGRNQAFNHAGNMIGAGLSGLFGWAFGLDAVFYLAAGFGVLSIVSILLIPSGEIDYNAARGLAEDGEDGRRASGFRVLVERKPLLILAAALAFFHLGNAAMLPLYGLAMSQKGGDPAGNVAFTIVVAQGVMVFAALAAMRLAEQRGFWLIILISFAALPLRGLVASDVISAWGVYPVQILDGLGAGVQSVAVPGLVARVLDGTGRVNAGQGAVMTMQGLGAALSPALGGWTAQALGYPATFLLLGAFALISVALWIGFAPIMRPACANRPEAKEALESAPASFQTS